MRSTYGTKTRSAVDGCSPPRIHGPGVAPSSFSMRASTSSNARCFVASSAADDDG